LYAEGKVGRDALLEAESRSYHGPGTCTFYGTANSNQMLMEIMGLHLPGASFVNPNTPLRDALTRAAARRITAITALGDEYTPVGAIVDERAVVNAVVGLHATGGSTNHTIHLVAMARAAGLQLTWDDFAELSEVAPLLCRIYPNGRADVNHFQAAGGMAFLIGELLDAGLLHPTFSPCRAQVGSSGIARSRCLWAPTWSGAEARRRASIPPWPGRSRSPLAPMVESHTSHVVLLLDAASGVERVPLADHDDVPVNLTADADAAQLAVDEPAVEELDAIHPPLEVLRPAPLPSQHEDAPLRVAHAVDPGARRADEFAVLELFRVFTETPDVAVDVLRKEGEFLLDQKLLALFVDGKVLVPDDQGLDVAKELGHVGDGEHHDPGQDPRLLVPEVCFSLEGEPRPGRERKPAVVDLGRRLEYGAVEVGERLARVHHLRCCRTGACQQQQERGDPRQILRHPDKPPS
jgi:Dehydratase family